MRVLGIYLLSLSYSLAVEPRISDLGISTYSNGDTKIADMDGDGDLDFVIFPAQWTSGTGQLTWFENMGDNSFSYQKNIGYNQESAPQYENIIADTNRDGLLELLTFDQLITGTELHIFDPLGTGNEAHVEKIPTNTLIQPFFVDLNQDFQPFILSFPYYDNRDSFQLLEITATRTITPLSDEVYQLPNEVHSKKPEIIKAIDLDNDGDRDLILSYYNPDLTLIYERISPTQLSSQPIITITQHFDHFTDLDGDGDIDLYRYNHWARNDGNFSLSVIPFLNSPSGEIIQTPLGVRLLAISDDIVEYELQPDHSWIESFRQQLPELSDFNLGISNDYSRFKIADFDNDGLSEIFLMRCNCFEGDYLDVQANHLTVFKRTENGYEEIVSSAPPLSIDYSNPIAADFDNDGDIDVLMGPSNLGLHYLRLNDGRGNFTLADIPLNFYPEDLDPKTHKITSLKAIHFDADAFLDLAITFEREINYNTVESACTIIKGTGPGTFAPTELPDGSFTFVPQGFCNITEFVDWDSDGDLDAILEGGWRENIDGELSPFFRPTLSNALISDALGNPTIAKGHQIADVDGDGFPDYIASVYSFKTRYFYIDSTTGIELDIPLTSPPPPPASIASEQISQIAIAFNKGDGTISGVVPIDISTIITDALGNPVTLAFGIMDLNADGQKEIISPVRSSDALGNPIVLSYNVWTTPEGEPRNFANAAVTTTSSLFIPISDELKDFDGDGTLEYTTENRFLKPSAQGPLISPTYNFRGDFSLFHGYAFQNAVATADFDGDGDLDALIPDGNSRLTLVRNLIIDERSSITRELLQSGLTGAQSDPSSDPDGDGLSNAMEYLSGTNPLIADASQAADLSASLQISKGVPELTFLRRKDAATHSLDYRLERSSDLLNWQPVSTDNVSIKSLNPDWEQITVEDSLNSGRFFYRTNPQHRP